MLRIAPNILIDEDSLEWQAIRAQGAGGQNVNKVSSALHLRFDIAAAALPEAVKRRLLQRSDQRITAAGVLIIKAQRYRTQAKNRADAIQRLTELIAQAAQQPKRRRPTRPTKAAKKRRLEDKTRRGQTKRLRTRIED